MGKRSVTTSLFTELTTRRSDIWTVILGYYCCGTNDNSQPQKLFILTEYYLFYSFIFDRYISCPLKIIPKVIGMAFAKDLEGKVVKSTLSWLKISDKFSDH